MEADKIKDVVDKIDDLLYKCILFDGVWGVGKTYAIQNALGNKKSYYKISMFGLQNSQQIYHEIVCQLTNLDNLATIVKNLGVFADKISEISDKTKKIKGVINSFIDEKELFIAISKGFSSWHYVVIDDLERLSKNVNLEEVMGIIEEIKGCNYVKVIILANKTEMEKSAKAILEKYEEKVIDRIYHITERPEKVEWGKLGIDASFMKDFLIKYDVKNLRTLQKAQNFYKDVTMYTESIKNDSFQEEIRLICFAIVIESIEKLYYTEIEDNEVPQEKAILQHLYNDLEHRVMKYLIDIKSGKGLVSLLYKYYHNEISLNERQMQIEYKIYLESGNIPNYYKTEAEIRHLLLTWEKQIDVTEDLVEITRLVDEYVSYNDILEEDSFGLLKKYEKKIYDMISKSVTDGNEDVLKFSYDLFYVSSDKVKQIYSDVCSKIKEEIIDSYIKYLCSTTSDKKAFEYSYRLRKLYENSFYKEVVRQKAEELYNQKSFPIDGMNEVKYHTCFNIMSILYQIDKEKFLEYCDSITCDKMAKHRISQLIGEIKNK